MRRLSIALLVLLFPLPTKASDPVAALVDVCNTRSFLARVRSLKAIIEGLPASEEGWSCATGGCVPFSARMYRALDAREPGQWRIYDGNVRETEITVGRRGQQRATINARHTFLVEVRAAGRADEIIVDPTYLQYFRDGASLGLPPVFVGTRAELVAIFTAHRAHILPKFIREVSGLVDPAEFVEAHYGFGRFEGRRVDTTLETTQSP